MFDQQIRKITLDLLEVAVRHPDPAVRARFADAFYQLQSLYGGDLPPGSNLDLPRLQQHRPEPSLQEKFGRPENVWICPTDSVFNYPKPQLNALNITNVLDNESLGLAAAERLFNRLGEAENLIRNEIARLQNDVRILIGNRILQIPFSASGVDVAAASQGTNLNKEKVNIAFREALSLWSAVTPLEFRQPLAGEQPRLRIHFVRDNEGSQELGNTAGFISSTPNGLIGGASVNIDCDNKLCVDRFLEENLHPTLFGPFDLVQLLAHEIGHALGIDHPPLDPTSGRETEPAIMSRSMGDRSAIRILFPYDIREVQRLHGTIHLAETVKSNLAETAQLIDASPEVQLERNSSGLVVFGPRKTRALLDVLVPAKGHLVNALRLKFRTITRNVFVNRVSVFDSIIPMQEFALTASSAGDEGLAGKLHDLRLGFLSRHTMRDQMLVRMEIFFEGEEFQSNFGVVQVEQMAVETIQQPQVLHL
jgi:Matrixin